MKPNGPDTSGQSGFNIYIAKSAQDAIEHYKAAIERNPSNSSHFNNLGLLFQETKQYDEAINCFRKAFSIDPNCLAAFNNLGILLY